MANPMKFLPADKLVPWLEEQAKARKDLAQAGQLLALLLDQDPESVETACQDLAVRGTGWVKHAKAALQRIEDKETAERVTGMLKEG